MTQKGRIIVAGIGPGSPEDITPAVVEAIRTSDIIIGYKYYFRQFIITVACLAHLMLLEFYCFSKITINS